MFNRYDDSNKFKLLYHGDAVIILCTIVLELDPVTNHVGEILLCLLRGRSTQTWQ